MSAQDRGSLYWHEFPTKRPDLPPVLLLHGFLGSGGSWREVAAGCASAFRCLCPDLPGHGRSGCPDGISFAHVGDAIVEGLRERGIARCGLVGYSLGGRLALYLAMEYPELFDRLVLESASPGIEDEEDRATRRTNDAALAQRIAAMAEDREQWRGFLREWYAQPIFSTVARNPMLLGRVVEQRMDNDPVRLAKVLPALGPGEQPPLWERLPGFATPTLLIVGAEDRKYRIIAEKMSELAPRMAVEAFAGCSHNVHLEKPAGYTTALTTFLLATGKD